MKRKVRVVVLFLLLVLLLGGWGKKQVELLNDKKLIDLNSALQICMPGADAPDDEINTDNEKEPENTEIPDDPTDQKDQKRTITISVRDRDVTYDSLEDFALNQLEDRIRKDYKVGITFRLVDDFAEAHVYKQIKRTLKQLEEEMGFSYTME